MCASVRAGLLFFHCFFVWSFLGIAMKDSGFSWRKRILSFKYAFRGIWLLVSKEHNAWIHCFIAVCVVAAGFLSGLDRLEWIAVVFAIGMVLAAEAVNTTIEYLCDFVSPEYSEAIKHTKDLAAGAVLILAIASVVIGGLVFLPKIF